MARDLVAKTPIDERLAALLEPAVAAMEFQLVRVRLGGGRRAVLQIMAERADGSMTVDDCAALSRQLSAVLDVEDPIEDEYVLEVSSPGVDRPLTRLADFPRFIGHEARLETRDPVDGRKRFRGPILAADEAAGTVTLEVEALGPTVLPFDSLADAKLMLTDALIAESLRRGKQSGDAALADGADVALAEDAEIEPADDDVDADGFDPDEDGSDEDQLDENDHPTDAVDAEAAASDAPPRGGAPKD